MKHEIDGVVFYTKTDYEGNWTCRNCGTINNYHVNGWTCRDCGETDIPYEDICEAYSEP